MTITPPASQTGYAPVNGVAIPTRQLRAVV